MIIKHNEFFLYNVAKHGPAFDVNPVLKPEYPSISNILFVFYHVIVTNLFYFKYIIFTFLYIVAVCYFLLTISNINSSFNNYLQSNATSSAHE